MFSDLMIIIYTLLFTYVWSFIAFPLLLKITKPHFVDGGWGIARTFGWLLIGAPIWFLAHAGLPVNTRLGVYAVTFAWIGFVVWYQKKDWKEIKTFLQEKRWLIIFEEILFIAGFIFLSIVRGFNPDINGLEKFMDGGLIISYLNSPTLPVPDMWLAGYSFNYYTFGHYLGAVATNFWGISPYLSYNILLGLLMGLGLSSSASLGINIVNSTSLKKKISQKQLLTTGTFAAFLTIVAGNTQAIWFFLKNHTFKGYWYPDATRFIPKTIHEFPSYSFIVSDLHAHVWSMVLVFLMISFIFLWLRHLLEVKDNILDIKRPAYLVAILMGGLLGLIASTSIWDGLVYSLLLTMVAAVVFVQRPRSFLPLLYSGLLVILTALISSSPWWLNFESISEGIALVPERSELWRLIVLWTGHVLFGVFGLGIVIKRLLKKKNSIAEQTGLYLIVAMVLSGFLLILLPEIMYIIDIYTTQPRANTMFKLTYQAFILLSLVGGWTIGAIQQSEFAKRIKFGLMSVILTVVIVVGIYPFFGYRDYYNALREYKGLDGLTWLQNLHPTDYNGILWLRDNTQSDQIILESVGDSYTTFARVSTFSGRQTVLGWRVHEWLWRGSYDIAGKRSGEVEQIYLHPEMPDSQALLRQYNVEYIFIGDKEREAYPELNFDGLLSLGKTVFKDGQTYIVKLPTDF